jgi:hypothetical protein
VKTTRAMARGILVGLLLLPSLAGAIPAIVFDTVPAGAGGTLTYAGAGGPLIAADIRFVEIAGDQTPLNAGVPLVCVDCLLNFTTGANTGEGPPRWTWDGGGSFVLTGDVPALGLVGATLISGSFTATANTPGLVAGENTALFIALGVDTKDPTLAAFYGLGPDGFQFANTEIALGTFVPGADGAFSATPNQADIINVALVPLPATVLLVGLGLLLVGRRVRCA